MKLSNWKLFSIHLFTLPLFRGKYWCFWLPAAEMLSDMPANLLAWVAYLLHKHTWVQKQTLSISNATSLLPLCWPFSPPTYHFLFLDTLFFFSAHWSCTNVRFQVRWRTLSSIQVVMHIFRLPSTSPGFLLQEVRAAEEWTLDFGLLLSRDGAGCLIEMEKLEDFSHKSVLIS